MAHFDEASGSTWTTDEVKVEAESGRALCQRYLELAAAQAAGDLGTALVGYEDLLIEHGSGPLGPTIEQQARGVLAAEPAQVANAGVCQRLDGYLERDWIPDLDTTLPHYYQRCGELYMQTGDYSQAVAMLKRFVVGYPTHPAYEAVEATLAEAAVAEARQAGAGEIGPPQAVGSTGSGPAVVMIQNDSPEQISLVFSGPEARFETLAPCATCADFTTDPEFCPEEGPIGRYEMPPGTYDVVVNSISDEGVIPFTGTWELAAGDEYYSCFFLVTE